MESFGRLGVVVLLPLLLAFGGRTPIYALTEQLPVLSGMCLPEKWLLSSVPMVVLPVAHGAEQLRRACVVGVLTALTGLEGGVSL